MAILSDDEILDLRTAAVAAGLAGAREALLSAIDVHLKANIPFARSPADQVLVDLRALNDAGQHADGSVPLARWLENASMLARPGDAPRFRAALEACRAAAARTA
jgi:hypothetical protein